MNDQPALAAETPEKQTGNSPGNDADPRIFAYNLNEKKTPGGMKVRVKIRVAAGPEARRLEARQNKAIMELLRWHQQHNSRQPRS